MQTKLKTLFLIVLALAFASLSTAPVFAQASTTQTTFSTAVAYGDTTVNLTSATSITGMTQGACTYLILADKEVMCVISISGTAAFVQRGYDGFQAAHTTAAAVWYGPPNYFSISNREPSGTCVAANEPALPRFFITTGNGWNCPTAGPRSGQWTLQYPAPGTFAGTDNSQYGAPSALQVCHAQYSFAVDGGVVGLITPSRNCTIPINAVIWQAYSVMTTAPIGSTGNVSVGLSAGAGGAAALLAATARGSLTIGTIWQSPMVQTTASASNTAYVKMSAAGSVTVTVATNALTAGVMDIYVYYTVLPA